MGVERREKEGRDDNKDERPPMQTDRDRQARVRQAGMRRNLFAVPWGKYGDLQVFPFESAIRSFHPWNPLMTGTGQVLIMCA